MQMARFFTQRIFEGKAQETLIAGFLRALSIKPLLIKIKTKAKALRLKNLHCSKIYIVGHRSLILV